MVIEKVGIKFTLCSRWAFPYHQGGIPMHNYFLLELLKDGMDIALCVLNVRSRELKYAGANNPLWIVKPEMEELFEIKDVTTEIQKIPGVERTETMVEVNP